MKLVFDSRRNSSNLSFCISMYLSCYRSVLSARCTPGFSEDPCDGESPNARARTPPLSVAVSFVHIPPADLCQINGYIYLLYIIQIYLSF